MEPFTLVTTPMTSWGVTGQSWEETEWKDVTTAAISSIREHMPKLLHSAVYNPHEEVPSLLWQTEEALDYALLDTDCLVKVVTHALVNDEDAWEKLPKSFLFEQLLDEEAVKEKLENLLGMVTFVFCWTEEGSLHYDCILAIDGILTGGRIIKPRCQESFTMVELEYGRFPPEESQFTAETGYHYDGCRLPSTFADFAFMLDEQSQADADEAYHLLHQIYSAEALSGLTVEIAWYGFSTAFRMPVMAVWCDRCEMLEGMVNYLHGRFNSLSVIPARLDN